MKRIKKQNCVKLGDTNFFHKVGQILSFAKKISIKIKMSYME